MRWRSISFQKSLLYSSLILFTVVAAVLIVVYNLAIETSGHYTSLANSFVHGKLYFMELPDGRSMDTVYRDGHYYWPLGPFPAVLLMPFAWIFNLFGKSFFQGYLAIPLIGIIGYTCYQLVKKIGFGSVSRYYLTVAFILSSMFIGIAFYPYSWYFAHLVAVSLLLAALWEFLTRKRPWMLGLLAGLLLATRLTAGFGLICLLVIDLISSTKSVKAAVSGLIRYFVGSPFLLIGILLGMYQLLCFGNVIGTGYADQILTSTILINNRSHGLFSLVHVPANLYYAILRFPQPVFRDDVSQILVFPYFTFDKWGMSIFFTSPYLLYLFLIRYQDRLSRILLITALVTSIPGLLYYGNGYVQFGYRYGLDFLPYLFLLFCREYYSNRTQVSGKLARLIIISALVNVYMVICSLSS